MQKKKNQILAIFSDVNSSPQLVAILQELKNNGGTFRVILIGEIELIIAKQIKALDWDLVIIRKRGRLGSALNLLIICFQILTYQPRVLFASGQFATAIGMFSAKLLNVPLRIFIRHHSSLHHKYKMKLGIWSDKMANRMATHIIAVSALVKNILISSEGVNCRKIRLVHNGVELAKFSNSNINMRELSDKNPNTERLFHIGVISRLTEWKGVEYTAQAFVRLQKEFPNSRLHIVGAFSDSYFTVIDILSPIDQDLYTLKNEISDIPNFLRGLDAFVHVPVGPDDEAFGIVYIEALASGISCIFTRSGVLNELEDPHKYAGIVGFRNSEEIYLNLKELIQGTCASKIAVPDLWLNEFSLEVMTKRYSDVLLGEAD
jgi:glycosyltransferase involved in cell wall biosynthesis